MSSIVPFRTATAAVVQKFAVAATNLESEVIACEDPEQAFKLVDDGLTCGISFVKSSLLYTVHAIALAKMVWDLLDVSQQEPFGTNFVKYISRKMELPQSPTTIDNYINVGETWLVASTQVAIPEKIELYGLSSELESMAVLDGNGKPICVEGNPWDVVFAKLLAARSRAKKDKMSKEDWGLLFNPGVSQGKLLDYWRGPTADPPVSGLVFTLEGGIICVSDDSDTAPIAVLESQEIATNPLAQQGWMRLQALLRIKREDDF